MKKTKNNNKAVIILTSILVVVILLVSLWGYLNFDAIKSTFDGNKLYTQDEVTEAYNKGLTDRRSYETQINELISKFEASESKLATQKQELELNKARVIELTTQAEVNSETIDELSDLLSTTEDSLNSYISDMDKIYDLLARDVEVDNLNNAKAIAILNKLLAINEETTEAISQLNSQLGDRDNTIMALNQELTSAHATIQNKSETISYLTTELESLSVEMVNDKYLIDELTSILFSNARNEYIANGNEIVVNIDEEFVNTSYILNNGELKVTTISMATGYYLKVVINNHQIACFENLSGEVENTIQIGDTDIYKIEIEAKGYGQKVNCNYVFTNNGAFVLVDERSYRFLNADKDNIRVGQTVTFQSNSRVAKIMCNQKEIQITKCGNVYISKFKVDGDIDIYFI